MASFLNALEMGVRRPFDTHSADNSGRFQGSSPAGPATSTATHVSGSGASTIGKLTLDPRTLTVHIGGRVSSLTETEFAILVLLMSHRGKALTRDELLDAVKHEDIPFERVIDRQICNIRHKIDVTPNSPSIIETVRGIGYRIDR
jgi:DNA-binding response OmpR family regulator